MIGVPLLYLYYRSDEKLKGREKIGFHYSPFVKVVIFRGERAKLEVLPHRCPHNKRQACGI
jgi:hypothetical protein